MTWLDSRSGTWLRRFTGRAPRAAMGLIALACLWQPPRTAAQTALFGEITFPVDFKSTLQAARAVMVEDSPSGMGLRLADNSASPNTLRSESYEYASGPLAKDHLTKIANTSARPELSDGTWEKVRYTLIVQLEPVGKKETHLSPFVEVEAQKRSFTGQAQWVPVASNGNLEETFALRLGRRLFGPEFTLEERKKFWERDPRYVPDPAGGGPGIPQPDSKRW